VTDNFIVGNFMQDNGGGVGQLGRSEGGSISRNVIAFNQSFNQGLWRTAVACSSAGSSLVLGGVTPAPGPCESTAT